MKNIKTYEDFVNEEINWKKALATGALATGMAMSNPSYSQTINKQDSILPSRISKNPVEIQNIFTLKEDSIDRYSFDNGVWKEGNVKSNDVYSKLQVDDIQSRLILTNGIKIFSLLGEPGILSKNYYTTENEIKKLLDSIYNYNQLIEIKFVVNSSYDNKLNLYTSEIINFIETGKVEELSLGANINKMIIKSGYVDGKKIVRFAMVDIQPWIKFDIDKAYMECDFDEFIKLFKY
jgi:hypothetical protein